MPQRHLSSGRISRQRRFLKTLAQLTLFFSLCYSALNFYSGDALLATLNVLLAAFSIGVLYGLANGRHVERIKWLFIAAQIVVLLVAFAKISTATVFLWAFLALPVGHRLLGLRNGSIVSLGFLCVTAAVFVARFGIDAVLDNIEATTEFVPVAAALFLMSFAYERDLQRTEAPLRERADLDPVTRLATRARFRDMYEQKRDDALAANDGASPNVSMILIDLDRFKAVNDTYGHAAGDLVLGAVSGRLLNKCRTEDLLGRVGGEELAIMLFGVEHSDAVRQAERLRRCIAESPIGTKTARVEITASIGVTTIKLVDSSFDALFDETDNRLYAAKRAGRNRVQSERVD